MLRAALLALFALFLAAASDAPSPSGGNIPKAPFIVQIQQAESQQAASTNTPDKCSWYSDPNWWVAGFTGGLFIATFGLWVFTGLLWSSTRNTAKAIVTNERPWVGPQTVGVEARLSPVSPISAWVEIRNFGKTPAHNMRVAFEGHILPRGTTPAAPSNADQAPKALFPNVPDFYYPFGHNRFITELEWDAIKKGEQVAWIAGRIDYQDPEQKWHYTNIRTEWSQARGAFVPSFGGNDAD